MGDAVKFFTPFASHKKEAIPKNGRKMQYYVKIILIVKTAFC